MQSHIPERKRSYSKRLIAVGLAVTVGFLAICGSVLWDNRDRDREEARRAAANLTATIGSEIARTFELYDLSLQAVVDGLKLPDLSKLNPSMRQFLLFDRAATAKDMGSIFVLDKDGTVTMDSRTLGPSADNYAQSDFFEVHKLVRDEGIYVSKAWVSASGEYLIAISRRLSDADGSFSGVVAGTLRLGYFHNIFRNLKLGKQDVLALIGGDGALLMRFPFDVDMIGRSVRQSPLFQNGLEATSGSFELISKMDGVKRLYVFQRVGNTPLIVSYGLSIKAIYADWTREAWRLGSLMLALCAMNIALIVFLARTLRSRSEAEYQLALAAKTDGLTGLLNRRSLDESFDLEWKRGMRTRRPVSLLMIDADKFKHFNDVFGHQAGDAALIKIAHCIESNARRATDISARYGGEEFAVLLPETTGEDALLLAEKIRSKVKALRAEGCRSDRIPTISVGVASIIPRPELRPRDLIKAADEALYEAKIKGRDCSLLAEIEINPDWTKWSVDPDLAPPEQKNISSERQAA